MENLMTGVRLYLIWTLETNAGGTRTLRTVKHKPPRPKINRIKKLPRRPARQLTSS
jgi:hypothetical protein